MDTQAVYRPQVHCKAHWPETLPYLESRMTSTALKRSAKRLTAKPEACPAHVMRLYKAVAHYLKKTGGFALLSSGVTIIQWPEDRPEQFTVGVKILGGKPTYSAESDAARRLKGTR